MQYEKISVFGANGMLGSDFVSLAQKNEFDVHGYDLPEFDITDTAHLEEVLSVSDIVINCAAYTNVEKAQSQPDIADKVNGYSLATIGKIAKDNNVPIIHISTDFVFDGEKDGEYLETDIPNPLSSYGASKLLGEKMLFESGCQANVIRVQWTYGKNGVNFITKILEAAKVRDELKIVEDQTGSPTHTLEVAKILIEILKMDTFPQGLYHLAASDYASRYEMTQYLFDKMQVETRIVPCKSNDFVTAAQRPLNSKFNCAKLEKLIGRKLPTWQKMLDNYIEENYA